MACMLSEDSYYRAARQSPAASPGSLSRRPERVAAIAVEARGPMKLRHVPLFYWWLMAKLPTHRHLVQQTAYLVIQRADHLQNSCDLLEGPRRTEETKQTVQAATEKGIALAFAKFDDTLWRSTTRTTTSSSETCCSRSTRSRLAQRKRSCGTGLIDNELKAPDTWEVAISAAKGNPDQTRDEWHRLLSENKLGALALLRNLRNMTQAGVNTELIRTSILNMKTERVLPFRFVSAARPRAAVRGRT